MVGVPDVYGSAAGGVVGMRPQTRSLGRGIRRSASKEAGSRTDKDGLRGSSNGLRGSALVRSQVANIQRARLLAAAARIADEQGYSEATVARVCERAKVSRRTFYELFADREACLAAVFDSELARVREVVVEAGLADLAWRERVRGALWAILCMFDREPTLARLCVVQSAWGGQSVLGLRNGALAELAAVIDEGRSEGRRGADCSPLTAEGLVGAAVSIVQARLLSGEHSRLRALQGELMSMIVLPYLGPGVARQERTRPAPAPAPESVPGGEARVGEGLGAGADPLQGITMRVTYRTALVLEVIGLHPGSSNRAVADLAGMSDQGQTSKLLARLEQYGLLANKRLGLSRGEPNAWHLTPAGEMFANTISLGVENGGRA